MLLRWKKSPGGNLHSAHQRANPLPFQSLHYSLCVHFLLIRLTVWCISLTWHNDADKTVADLLMLVTDSNLVGNKVVLTTMHTHTLMHTHTQANNLVWIISATVCLNDFYTHFNGSLWCDNTNSPPVKGRWRKSGNYFSIRVSVNPLPHLAPLLTGNDWATTSTTLPMVQRVWFPKACECF